MAELPGLRLLGHEVAEGQTQHRVKTAELESMTTLLDAMTVLADRHRERIEEAP